MGWTRSRDAAMKLLHSSRTLDIPEGITLEVKARTVRVKGPRGESFTTTLSSLRSPPAAQILQVSDQ